MWSLFLALKSLKSKLSLGRCLLYAILLASIISGTAVLACSSIDWENAKRWTFECGQIPQCFAFLCVCVPGSASAAVWTRAGHLKGLCWACKQEMESSRDISGGRSLLKWCIRHLLMQAGGIRVHSSVSIRPGSAGFLPFPASAAGR